MNQQSARTLAALVTLLAGCASTSPTKPDAPADPAAAAKGTTTVQACGSFSLPIDNTCRTGPGGRTICPIFIMESSNPSDPPMVFPNELMVKASAGEVLLVWRLLNSQASFESTSGIVPKVAGNRNFANGDTADDDGTPASGHPAKGFRFRFLNLDRGTHHYNITFKSVRGTTVTCDPKITSASG